MSKLLREYVGLSYGKNIIEEAAKASRDRTPLCFPAILQRANTPNQNKRIYAREVLEREVENYQKLVNEGRSGGQLDHPESCFPQQYQLLTRDRSWQYIGEVREGELIVTLNPETKNIEYKPVRHKIVAKYEGDLLQLKGRSFYSECTPNHRWLMNNRNGKSTFVTAENLENYDSHYLIPKTGNWEGEDPKVFTLPGVDDLPSIDIKIEDWCAFFGLYISEGHVAGSKGSKKKTHAVGVTQVYNQDLVEEVLNPLPLEFKKYNEKQYVCCDKRLHTYLSQFGNSPEKFIPTEMKQYSPRLLSIVFDWMMFGDGTKANSFHIVEGEKKKYTANRYASTSPRLIGDVQEILMKMGKTGHVHTEIRGDREIEGRTILAENSKPMHIAHVSSTKGTHLGQGMKINKVPFNGMVYCVSVPNEVFYVRHDEQQYPTWTGNSVVELQNVSHKIKEIGWDGDDVIGIVEIHPALPKGRDALGLMEAGLKVGISSRGVGDTVQNDEGYDMVDESFMLIAFDLVSEPSTHEAWLRLKEGRSFGPEDIKKMISKTDRINRIANAILRK